LDHAATLSLVSVKDEIGLVSAAPRVVGIKLNIHIPKITRRIIFVFFIFFDLFF
jgi:hypothetical protein